MTSQPKHLEALRDRLAYKYAKIDEPKLGSITDHYVAMYEDFQVGFDACYKIMSEREKILLEVLKSIRVQAVVNGVQGHEAVTNRINEALDKLAKMDE